MTHLVKSIYISLLALTLISGFSEPSEANENEYIHKHELNVLFNHDLPINYRIEAWHSIMDHRCVSEDQIGNLISLFYEEDDFIRFAALEILSAFSHINDEVAMRVSQLVLHDKDEDVRLSGVRLFGRLGAGSGTVLSALRITAFNDKYYRIIPYDGIFIDGYTKTRIIYPVRIEARIALAKIEGLDGLLKALEHHRVDVRKAAARELTVYLPNRHVFNELKTALSDPESVVVDAAAHSLSKFRAGVDILLEALINKRITHKEVILWALDDVYPKEEEVVSGLIQTLYEESPMIRKEAALVLGLSGKDAINAVNDLVVIAFTDPYFETGSSNGGVRYPVRDMAEIALTWILGIEPLPATMQEMFE